MRSFCSFIATLLISVWASVAGAQEEKLFLGPAFAVGPDGAVYTALRGELYNFRAEKCRITEEKGARRVTMSCGNGAVRVIKGRVEFPRCPQWPKMIVWDEGFEQDTETQSVLLNKRINPGGTWSCKEEPKTDARGPHGSGEFFF